MENTYTQSEHDEIVVREIRKAIEHRATWMYLLLQEARDRGLDWDDFARPAIRATGCLGGQKRREDAGSHQHGGVCGRFCWRHQPEGI